MATSLNSDITSNEHFDQSNEAGNTYSVTATAFANRLVSMLRLGRYNDWLEELKQFKNVSIFYVNELAGKKYTQASLLHWLHTKLDNDCTVTMSSLDPIVDTEQYSDEFIKFCNTGREKLHFHCQV